MYINNNWVLLSPLCRWVQGRISVPVSGLSSTSFHTIWKVSIGNHIMDRIEKYGRLIPFTKNSHSLAAEFVNEANVLLSSSSFFVQMRQIIKRCRQTSWNPERKFCVRVKNQVKLIWIQRLNFGYFPKQKIWNW